MLSVSSIQTISPTPVVRPSLVADAVRASTVSSPLKAIEPTTAISKERSRAENKTPEAGTSAVIELAARVSSSPQAGAQAVKQSGTGGNQSAAQSNTSEPEQPPVEKSPIQKAMDTQIKSLLSNVWKASARAVDFLLGRDAVEKSAQAAERASKLQAEIWPVLKQSPSSKAGSTSADTAAAMLSYTSKGGADKGAADSRGRIVDLVA